MVHFPTTIQNTPPKEPLQWHQLSLLTMSDHSDNIRETHFYTACDKVFQLLTGSFALSITFRNTLTGTDPKCIELLLLAWSFMFFGILGYLIGLLARALPDEESKIKSSMIRFAARNWHRLLFGSFGLSMMLLLSFAAINSTTP